MERTLKKHPPVRLNDKCSFEIVRTLGVGGMATVYLARQDGGREVAVKKLHAFLAEDPASVAILEDEARLGAAIRHPNVVGVLELVKDGDAPALVMEWVEGVDLGKLLRAAGKSGRRLPLDVAAAIARDVLLGLHAAHESRREDGVALDIVHRDVSPQNVLVGSDGVVRVTDFGVAKAAFRIQHTEAGSIKGKLGYLAPEQLEGRCDRRSDVYGAGVVLFELLTGARLRAGEGVEVLVEILCGRAPAPSARGAESSALDDVVLRALERCPEDRFATAAAMAEAIGERVEIATAARVAEVVRALLADEAQAAPTTAAEVTLAEEITKIVPVPTVRVFTPVVPERSAPSRRRPAAFFGVMATELAAPPPPPRSSTLRGLPQRGARELASRELHG